MRRCLVLLLVFVALQLAMGGLAGLVGLGLGLTLLLTNGLVIAFMVTWERFWPTAEWRGYVRPSLWVAALATFVVLIAEVNGLLEIIDLPDWTAGLLDEGTEADVAFVVAAVLVGPIAEEMIFRRGMIDGLRASRVGWARRWAVPLSAIVFGLVHFNPMQSVGALVLGLFLGWVYVRTRSLLLPIVCHVINNGLSVLLGDMRMMDVVESRYKLYVCLCVGAVVLGVALVQLGLMLHGEEEREVRDSLGETR